MALTTTPDATKLGCGRDVDDLWDNIGHPPSPHEAGCPDCQAARADLSELNTATQQMVQADVADPTLRVDPAVLDNIVAIAGLRSVAETRSRCVRLVLDNSPES